MWHDVFTRLRDARLDLRFGDDVLGVLAVIPAVYGDFENAVEVLSRIRDEHTYIAASLRVAVELFWKGDVDRAEMLVNECVDHVEKLGSVDLMALVPSVAYAKTLIGGLQEGVAVAYKAEGVWLCRAILAVASAAAEMGVGDLEPLLGDLEGCLKRVFDEERARILLEAGRTMLEAGRCDEARKLLETAAEVAMNLYDGFSKRLILSELVPLMIDAGLLAKAVVLSSVLDLAGLQFLEEIGEKAGLHVLEMPLDALDRYGRAVLVLRGAETSLSREVTVKASEYIAAVSGCLRYPELLARLAAVQAKIGMREGEEGAEAAVNAARGLQLVRVAEAVAEHYASHAERALEKACKEAEGMKDEEKVLVLMRAAAVWSKIKRFERAVECFREAARLVVELGSRELIVELSRNLASCASPELVFDLLNRFPDVESRLDLLAGTAYFLLREGKEYGVELAEKVASIAGGAATLLVARLAALLSRVGRVREAGRLVPAVVEEVVRGAEGRSSNVQRFLGIILEIMPRLKLRFTGDEEALLVNEGGSCLNMVIKQKDFTLPLGELKSGGSVVLNLKGLPAPTGEVKVVFEDAFGVEECTLRIPLARQLGT
ncbi:MAG: hypothetical protein QXX87_00040 [Candidatus Jordarchaeales archaeon]